jgi:hypothetical protein
MCSVLQIVGHKIVYSLLASLLFNFGSEYATRSAQENWKELGLN